jgi:hypothetical protein
MEEKQKTDMMKMYEKVMTEGKLLGEHEPIEMKLKCDGYYTVVDLEKKISELKGKFQDGIYILEEKDKVYIALHPERESCFGCADEVMSDLLKYLRNEYLKSEASAINGKEVTLLDQSSPGPDVAKEFTRLEQLGSASKLREQVLGFENIKISGCDCDTGVALLMMRLKYTLGAKSLSYVARCASRDPPEPVTI